MTARTISIICLIIVSMLTSCGPAEPTVVIEVDHSSELLSGETIILRGRIPQGLEGEVQYHWSATRGKLSKTEGPTVEFVAPDETGRVVITLEVQVAQKNYSTDREFQVVAGDPQTSQQTESTTATAVVLEVAPGDLVTQTSDTVKATETALPVETEAPTPSPEPTRNPDLIDDMEHTFGWSNFNDSLGSSMTLRLVPGVEGNALEIGYDLKEWGFVGIMRGLEDIDLEKARGIRFTYRGSGAPATIETKLSYASGAIFGYNISRGTANTEWGTVEIPFGNFFCWPDTGCVEGQPIDPAKVTKLDFAVSSKEGDTPGQGSLVIDQVELVR